MPSLIDLNAAPVGVKTQEYLSTLVVGHFIDGRVVPSLSAATLPIMNPATGQSIGEVALGNTLDLNAAVSSARRSFSEGVWRNLAPLEKERRLRRLGKLVAESGEIFSDVDTLNAGLLQSYTRGVVQSTVDKIDYYAGWPTKISGSIPPVPAGVASYVSQEPIGVVGVIVPSNGPTAVLGHIAAALACGNSVVVKPAEQTPIVAVLAAQLCIEAGVPSGVVNVIQGTGSEIGAEMVADPGVDMISFVGSVDVGRRIHAGAAPRLKRVVLELGGKSANVIFEDADLEVASATAAKAVWSASGQICAAGSRVLVQRSIYDDVVHRIASLTRGLRIGSPFDPEVEIGPLFSEQQLGRVQSYVQAGQKEGATLVVGGQSLAQSGYFHEPTVFSDVSNEMEIARNEIFGPVMCVIPFETEEQAVAIANDSDYGLAAGVWTNDLARAHRMSRALEAGAVWVDSYLEMSPTVPLGGVKQSGYGRLYGEQSLAELLQTKTTWIRIAS